MICLGIETTAHTFGIGIMDDKGKVLANESDSHKTRKGGIIPILAATHHVELFDKIIDKALKKADLKIGDIDVIAFSQGPGLGHCLRIGAMVARVLAMKHKKPLVGVNHCIAHLTIGTLMTGATDPILLYASGANTQIITFEGGRYRVVGETLDIGTGNLLDSVARYMGLGFPGGPKIYELAKKGKKFIELPYSVKGMDVSFGGLLTNVKQKIKSGRYKKEDLCYSVQETVFAMLLEVSERALAHCDKKELLLGGGVCCNKRLQEMAHKMCNVRNAKCFVPPAEVLVDNGLMIAWLGLLEHKAGNKLKIRDSFIKPYWRTDQVGARF